MIKRLLTAIGISALCLLAFAAGYLCHRNEWIPGSWRDWYHKTPPSAEKGDLLRGAWSPKPGANGDATQEQWEQLASVGYLDSTELPASTAGVVKNVRSRVAPGLNLCVSGHAPEAVLMDCEGRVVHEWKCAFEDAWPGYQLPDSILEPTTHHWRRARLLDNGDLLAIYSGVGLVKLDKDSHLLWTHPGHSHHDLDVAQNGDVYVIDCEAHIIPEIAKDQLCVEDFISILSSDGKLKKRFSLLKSFRDSDYASVLDKMPYYGDLFHTNTLELFDGSLAAKSPLFKAGNCLISLFKLNTIAIVDTDKEQVVWALSGMWTKQHQPTLLPSGNMLIFDNLGHNGHSKVIEFDPFTQNIVWSYRDSKSTPLFSKGSGSCQRLPNGNTLITESTNGRALEVTTTGETVWEYINPHEAGDKNQFIAVLFEVIRLNPDFPLNWLDADNRSK